MANLKKTTRVYSDKTVKNFKEREKEYNEMMLQLDIERQLEEREAESYRGRTLNVGGDQEGVEISIRMCNGKTAWHQLSPIGAIEFMHSIASRIGCHIAVAPREDFSSYRNWENYIPYDVKHDSTKMLASGGKLAALEQQQSTELNKQDNNLISNKNDVSGDKDQ